MTHPRIRIALLAGLALLLAPPAGLRAAPPDSAAPAGAARDQPAAVNTRLARALAALLDRKWQDAESLLQQEIAANPAAADWELYQALGRAQLGLGQFADAIRSYDRGIALARKSLAAGADAGRVNAALEQMLMASGNACVRTKQPDQAIARYTEAAGLSPRPATAWFNICATYFNRGDMERAAAAADRAIAADPQVADAHFIRGAALFTSGRYEGDRFAAPPGTAEALRKYLELAPAGPHAADVRAMLAVMSPPPPQAPN